MRSIVLASVVAALATATAASVALGQEAPAAETMSAVAASGVTWTDAEVPGFAPGMKIAVVHGDPQATGAYTLRLSFPDGYNFPAHWHPMAENVTVLSGTLKLGMGDRPDDAKLKVYGAGAYLHIPAKMPHFGGAQGATVIQLHGEGPFAINLTQSTSSM